MVPVGANIKNQYFPFHGGRYGEQLHPLIMWAGNGTMIQFHLLIMWAGNGTVMHDSYYRRSGNFHS